MAGRPYGRSDTWYAGHYLYAFEGDTVARSLFPIARFAGNMAAERGAAAVVLSSLRVWPSSQDVGLITSFLRCSAGIEGGLPPDGTILLVEAGEGAALASLLHMAMISGWDCEVYCQEPGLQIEIDHDGVIRFFVADAGDEFPRAFAEHTSRELKRIRPAPDRNDGV